MKWLLKITISALCVWCVWINVNADYCCPPDRPCMPRNGPGGSVVCVCDPCYYDTITRDPTTLGQYNTITSSQCGLRFSKDCGSFCPVSDSYNDACVTIQVRSEEGFQCIEGFGTSMTDAAGINWFSLPRNLRNAMIESYFGPTGIELNLIRTPIGGSDFSTRPYTYQDYPECDPCLSAFSLTYEDYSFKIPMIRAALRASCGNAKVLGSCWSPPAWMKTNDCITGRGCLLSEYYQTYADYHYKFIDAYCKEGIPIWGITTTNEPANGLFGLVNYNCLGWTPQCLGTWIAEYLGPTLCNSPYCDVNIICADDQRFNLPIYVTEMLQQVPEALQYITGIAVHWYGNFISPPSLYNYISSKFCDLFIISTQASEGFTTGGPCLGSWQRAQTYASDIISSLNYGLVGWIDWNCCLDPQGGPNWVCNYMDSPIIVYNECQEFVKQPTFYALGHFSKYIPRGSVRINLDYDPVDYLEFVAVRTPEQNIVVVFLNTDCCTVNVQLIVGCQQANLCLVANSITTVEFPFCNNYFNVRRGYVRPYVPPRCQQCRFNPYAECGCYTKGSYAPYQPPACCYTPCNPNCGCTSCNPNCGCTSCNPCCTSCDPCCTSCDPCCTSCDPCCTSCDPCCTSCDPCCTSCNPCCTSCNPCCTSCDPCCTSCDPCCTSCNPCCTSCNPCCTSCDPCCTSCDPCCTSCDPCCTSCNPCCTSCDPCCTSCDPCCTSCDPCCTSCDPCCTSCDPCCTSCNPCCTSCDPCCTSCDPCCTSCNPCCTSCNPCCTSCDPCCTSCDPCCTSCDPCCTSCDPSCTSCDPSCTSCDPCCTSCDPCCTSCDPSCTTCDPGCTTCDPSCTSCDPSCTTCDPSCTTCDPSCTSCDPCCTSCDPSCTTCDPSCTSCDPCCTSCDPCCTSCDPCCTSCDPCCTSCDPSCTTCDPGCTTCDPSCTSCDPSCTTCDPSCTTCDPSCTSCDPCCTSCDPSCTTCDPSCTSCDPCCTSCDPCCTSCDPCCTSCDPAACEAACAAG